MMKNAIDKTQLSPKEEKLRQYVYKFHKNIHGEKTNISKPTTLRKMKADFYLSSTAIP